MEVFEDYFGEESLRKIELDATRPAAAPSGCFDCNICLDFAVEPVVTLCGHLYCWPCIYKWLHLEGSTAAAARQRCPVCKAALSQATLVPLYGRGGHDSNVAEQQHDRADDVPSRPSVTMTASVSRPHHPPSIEQQQHHHHRFHHHHQFHHHHHHLSDNYTSTTTTRTRVLQPTMLGGTAVAVLPWVFGDQMMGFYYSNPHLHLLGSGDSPRLRRQELQASRSLNRISMFLFCCVVLCLLLF